jgi:hypothetical protein
VSGWRSPLLGRFHPRAGLVASRQRFVHCCHRAWTDISKSRQPARSSNASRASPLLGRLSRMRDLLLRAKDLFIAAIVPRPIFLRAASRHARRTPVGLLRFLVAYPACGTCYSAPKICSSLPELCGIGGSYRVASATGSAAAHNARLRAISTAVLTASSRLSV